MGIIYTMTRLASNHEVLFLLLHQNKSHGSLLFREVICFSSQSSAKPAARLLWSGKSNDWFPLLENVQVWSTKTVSEGSGKWNRNIYRLTTGIWDSATLLKCCKKQRCRACSVRNGRQWVLVWVWVGVDWIDRRNQTLLLAGKANEACGCMNSR